MKENLHIIAYSLIYHLCLMLIKVVERKPFWEIGWYGTQFKIMMFKINENAQVHYSVQPPRWSGTKNKPNKFSFCFDFENILCVKWNVYLICFLISPLDGGTGQNEF